MAFTEYGPYWRTLRKLCTSQLLSASKIESFAALRREAVRLLVESLRKSSAASEIVDLSQKLGEISADISCGMILGRNKGHSYRLKELVHEALCLMGTFNIADYVPFLEPFDLQGLRRSMKNLSQEIDEVLDRIIMEHERVETVQQVPYKDFVDILLSLIDQPMNPQDQHVYFIDRTTIKAILVDLTVASFDTSATSIDWALSELLKNPRVMQKLQSELETSIGMDQIVEEKDLGKLQYLDMVVKESFRLHPVAPFLIPRESMEDVTIEGYYIPKKSQVLVNTWSIGRDPSIWSENAEDFYPERFIGTNLGVRGQDFQLLPFGSGRRGCPGMQLGLTTVHLVLAQLVHCFNWEIPIGIEDRDIDMNEKLFGLSMGRANHLLARPSIRLLCDPTDDIFNVFSKK